jgi:uroporphyrinogen-III synthase
MSAPIAYVLSTRVLSAALIEEAAAKRINIDVVPFIGTAKLQNERLAKQLGELVRQPLTAIFTSTNAVTAIESGMPPGWKIFCINGATRRAAAERFGEHSITGVADSAAELAEIITSPETPGECWFFCGDKRREELPERLKAAGWQVHEVVVYQTILTPQRIDKSYDAVIFLSPSAVESFFSMNTIGPKVRLFAIGKTTAAAIHTKCPNPVSISEKPDEQILIRQLLEWLDAARPKDKH